MQGLLAEVTFAGFIRTNPSQSVHLHVLPREHC